MRGVIRAALFCIISVLTLGKSAQNQAVFEIADVHASPPSPNALSQFARGPFVAGGRYELRQATLVDLIRIAYSPAGSRTLDLDKVFGGPSWLDLDRFDVVAKVPSRASREDMKIMLKALLTDRFKLSVHEDTKPLPAYALTVAKKPLLKEANGSEEHGCKPQSQSSAGSAPTPGTIRLAVGDGNGNPIQLVLGAGALLTFACRNMTMAEFADGMRNMIFAAAYLNNNRVVDQTNLKGGWNFDVQFSPRLGIPGTDNGGTVTLQAAIQKLGLDLTFTKLPVAVLVVDNVSKTLSANPPGVAEALPALGDEFEVADIKPTPPDLRGGRFQVLPSGRVNIEGMTLRNLIERAWDMFPLGGDETLVGPKFIDSARFNIVAKAPTFPSTDAPSSEPVPNQQVDPESINPMLRKLLVQSFGLVFHAEERPVTTFILTAAKPKLQKADPSNRTTFYEGPGPDGKDQRIGNPALGRLVTCQNMTMGQFAANLGRIAGGYIRNAKVVDETGLQGSYDFTIAFSAAGIVNGPAVGARGGDPGVERSPSAAEPNSGVTLFEALEKQFGLQLKQTKRPGPVMVIDHIEGNPKQQ
jgi:uncharacterized protein (TIGR03435 family)